MNKTITSLFILCLFPFLIFSQTDLSLWQDHFSYLNIQAVCQTNNKTIIGAAQNGLLLIYDDGSTEKLSKASGLSDIGITSMNYSQNLDLVVVGYSNGNIDIISGKDIWNISDIKRKNMNTDKTINSIYIYGDFAYLSCGFGIIKLDLNIKEISDTYFIGQNAEFINVNKTILINDSIYAASNNGLYCANINDFLADFNNWKIISNSSFPVFKDIIEFNSKIYAVAINNSEVYQLIKRNSGNFQIINSDIGKKAKLFTNEFLYIANQSQILTYNTNDIITKTITTYNLWDFKPNCINFDSNNQLIIGDRVCGLITSSNSEFFTHFISGIYEDESFKVNAYAKNIFVSRGGYKVNSVNLWNSGTINILSQNKWTHIIQDGASDFNCILADPSDFSHFFVGSWGYGVFEYQNEELKNHYDQNNSPLESIIPGNYTRISGLTYDNEKNLWIINAATDNSINILKNDGTWKSLLLNRVLANDRTGDLIFTSNNQIWAQLPDKGLFVLDYNNTVDNENDDIYKVFYPRDENGDLFGSQITCIAEDKDGEIWFGSDEGVGVIYEPTSFDGNTPEANRIKITSKLNDSLVTSYLLLNEQITCMTIDGGNRKWFGTISSGVFLINSSGTEQILHFDADNSPLPSSKINSISIDPSTGEVYIATNMGLVSYKGTSTQGDQTYQNVYAYPNPVRHDYSGIIYIKGLVEDSNVKITDIAGNIVYETTSNGGMATWNGNNFDGNRVATGIYLIFCQSSDGKESFVSKLLFIK